VLINVGRVGLCMTLLAAFPLIMLPCRNAFQRLLVLIPKHCNDCMDGGEWAASKSPFVWRSKDRLLGNDGAGGKVSERANAGDGDGDGGGDGDGDGDDGSA
jgi:hypothetical protein